MSTLQIGNSDSHCWDPAQGFLALSGIILKEMKLICLKSKTIP